MLSDRVDTWTLGLRLGEALCVMLSAAIAYGIRFHIGWFPTPKGIPPFSWYAVGSVVAIGYQQALFQSRRWYAPRSLRRPPPWWTWLFASGALGLLFAASTFFLRAFEFSRGFLLLWICVLGAILLSLRLSVQRAFGRAAREVERVLMVGDALACRRLEPRLRQVSIQPFEVVGRASDSDQTPSTALGSLEDIPALVASHQVQRVVVATAGLTDRATRRIVRSLDEELVAIDLVLDLDRLSPEPYRVDIEDGIGRIVLQGPPLSGAALLTKRAVDLFGASLGLLLSAPIMAIVTLAIRLSSPGPILYRQERISLDGRRFQIVKFRTMRVDAERDSGPVFAESVDPRAYPLGRFLRRWSFDELPQLWNVLRGDMSLVGPRPERPHFVESFRRRLPRYAQRHWLRSGLTGWAQVNGLRGQSSIRKRLQYDLYYLRHWSLWFDLRILLMTLTHGVHDRENGPESRRHFGRS